MGSLGKSLWLITLAGAIVAPAVLPAMAAEPTGSTPRWKTGKQFHRALADRLEIVGLSPGTPVRSALERLAQRQGIAIMLDRRIDPAHGIGIELRDVTLARLLDEIAAQCGATPSYVGSVVYLGPREATINLSKVVDKRREEVRRLPRGIARRLIAARPWHWDRLAVPRDLINELARQAGIHIEALDQVPHDLWPAADLPPLSWIERLTLILTGFDLTFEFTDGGRAVRLVPLARQQPVVRSYPATLPQMALPLLAARFPNARIEASADGVVLRGTVEEHERLRRLLQQQVREKRTARPTGKTVHSLKVTDQRIGAILRSLEQKLDMRFQYADDVRAKLTTRVTLDLRDVTLDQLLTETLAPAGLVFERVDKVVTIRFRLP